MASMAPFPPQELPSPGFLATAGLVGGGRQGSLPADGQHTHDDDGCAELFHAFLDDDAIDGPASVVGKEGLPAGDRAGSWGRLQTGGGSGKVPRLPSLLTSLAGFFSLCKLLLSSQAGAGGRGPSFQRSGTYEM